VTGHLLDAGERRAGDLVAAETGVDVDEDTGLWKMSAFKSNITMGCTHVGSLVERGSGCAGGDSRAGAADLDVDALQFHLVMFNWIARRVVLT
jgi:hypothetical protein